MSQQTKSKLRLEPLLCEFTVLIDTREQAPWAFQGIRGRASQHNREFIVPVRVAGLATGDYSIEGLTDHIAVERKSLADLFGTILGDRERFERELSRLNELQRARVIVEGDWLLGPPRRPAESDGEYQERASRQLKVVESSINSWECEFPRVHWKSCHSRRMAEVVCFRTLEMFWRRRKRETESEPAE